MFRDVCFSPSGLPRQRCLAYWQIEFFRDPKRGDVIKAGPSHRYALRHLATGLYIARGAQGMIGWAAFACNASLFVRVCASVLYGVSTCRCHDG
jgi:hypothetical protein